MVKSKKLNALAVTGPTRIGVLPDVPTMAESGIPDYQVVDAIGFITPAHTPPAALKAANAVIREILQMEDVAPCKQDERALLWAHWVHRALS
jgi:tripartite-type tricarboxylate transporter receptor subunit TctC